MSIEQQARDAHFDRAVREAVTGIAPRDLLQRVRARIANPAPDERQRLTAQSAPLSSRRTWLAAACVLLGLGTLLAVALSQQPDVEDVDGAAAATQTLQDPVRVTVKTAEQLGELTAATTHLRVLRVTAADFVRLVPQLPRLEELDLDGLDGARMGTLTVEVLAKVGTFANLRTLYLPGRCELRDAWLKSLTGLPLLERIDLSHAQIGEVGIAHLASLPSLQWLDVAMNQTLTDAALARLIAGAPGLRRLSIAGCGALTSAGVQRLQALRRLKHLDVSWIRGANLLDVIGQRGHPSLLANWRMFAENWNKTAVRPGEGVDDAAIAALAKIESLRYLNLSGCRAIRRNGFELLQNTRISDLRLDDLQELPANLAKFLPKTVTNISMCRTPIVDRSLDHLATSMLLVELRIAGCAKVTASGLQAVLARHQLFSLDIGECYRVKKTILPALLKQKKLFSLRVSGLPWVDDAVAKELDALPRLDFLVGSWR